MHLLSLVKPFIHTDSITNRSCLLPWTESYRARSDNVSDRIDSVCHPSLLYWWASCFGQSSAFFSVSQVMSSDQGHTSSSHCKWLSQLSHLVTHCVCERCCSRRVTFTMAAHSGLPHGPMHILLKTSLDPLQEYNRKCAVLHGVSNQTHFGAFVSNVTYTLLLCVFLLFLSDRANLGLEFLML